jgi:hypothetical protein
MEAKEWAAKELEKS